MLNLRENPFECFFKSYLLRMKSSPIPDEYKTPVRHSMCRRAFFIDYRNPRIFLFTIGKGKACPDMFSVIEGDPHKGGIAGPKVVLTEAGQILEKNILKLESLHPDQIKLYRWVIMPDHVHIMLEVIARLKLPVTHNIGRMMSASTSEYKLLKNITDKKFSLFDGKGIHDRPLSGKNQLDAQKRYVEDNPLRYLIKKKYPDLFARILGIRLGGELFNGMGNIFLLRKSDIRAVHVRRKWSEEEREDYHSKMILAVKNGAVLVSPFISEYEKSIMREGLSAGGSIIRLSNKDFKEREKPSKTEFELCAEGRLLILTPVEFQEVSGPLSRAQACRLNSLSEEIASIPVDARLGIKV